MANADAMSRAPRWYRPVAGLALLWNLAGCAAFFADAASSAADIANLPPAQQALYAARPAWSIAGTAIAVLCGAAGCVGLILLKRWAGWLLIASLVGVALQDIWLFLLSGAVSAASPVAFVLQGVVLLVAVALVFMARTGSTRGWLGP